MGKRIVFYVCTLIPCFLFSQNNIKAMVYNLLEFPEANPQNRELILRDILTEFPPDIFMVCELQSDLGADFILNTALNVNNILYDKATFVPNQSGNANLQQLLFFRKDKFILEAEEILQTNIRDINHYTLTLRTADIQNNPVRIEIFIGHLKSSEGGSNEQQRLEMVLEFTSKLEALDPNAFVIFAGDFNIYSSTEPAYIELLDTTNAITMLDPIDTPGAWSGNINFQDIHTQSTRVSSGPFGAGAGGGLDDRFDFILLSENMLSDPTFRYIPNTYKAFGNNGNCFDQSINNTQCFGSFNATLRENLYNMSDHLPVIIEFETDQEIILLNTPSPKTQMATFSIPKTIVSQFLEIQNTNDHPIELQMISTLGQHITHISLKSRESVTLDVSYLPTGVYYVTDTFKITGVKKFIKQ